MRGRKPKPVARQISEGDPRQRGVHKLQERLNAEPNVKHGLPACPRHLRGRARSAWTFWVTELEFMNLDAKPDAMALEGACSNYARAVTADLAVNRDGITVEEAMVDKETGERIVLKIRTNPAVHISNAAWRQVRAFCSEFGFSPVSRTRLAVDKADKTPDLLAILSKPREKRGESSTTVQ